MELHILEEGQSLSSSIRKPHKLFEAVVLLCPHNAAQHASLKQLCLLIQRGTGAFQILLIIINNAQCIVVIVIVAIIVSNTAIVIIYVNDVIICQTHN